MLCTKVRAKPLPPVLSTRSRQLRWRYSAVDHLSHDPPEEMVAANDRAQIQLPSCDDLQISERRALPDVSLPDSDTASHPRNGENSTNRWPVEAAPSPSV